MVAMTAREKRSIEKLTIVLLCLKEALVLKYCRKCSTRRCFAPSIVFCLLSHRNCRRSWHTRSRPNSSPDGCKWLPSSYAFPLCYFVTQLKPWKDRFF